MQLSAKNLSFFEKTINHRQDRKLPADKPLQFLVGAINVNMSPSPDKAVDVYLSIGRGETISRHALQT
jgi:hypothetical protein